MTQQQYQLKAGAGRADISPRLGMQIDGNIGVHRPAEFLEQPLYANALVLEQDGKRFCFLSMDLLAITHEWSDKVRDMLVEQFGFERAATAVHVTQCHSAPSLGQIMLRDRYEATKKYPWLLGSDPEYGPMTLPRIQEAVRQACENSQPVLMSYGAGLEDRVAFNRRFVLRDGTAAMGAGPGGMGMISHREGPNDPELGVAVFASEDLKNVAALLHHTCHPVHWNPHTAVHADWPGTWAQYVQEQLLPGATAMAVNGCCGNVHHNNVIDPSQIDTVKHMSELLTQTTEGVLRTTKPEHNPKLDWISETIQLPFRDFPPELFENAHKYMEEHPEPTWLNEEHTRVDWEWCYAAAQLDLEQLLTEQDSFEYEVQAMRIGNLAILVLIGEPFVEAQLEIKQRSPADRTFVAHMSNGYAGYIPTPHAIKGGGYETNACMASKFAPEALQMITDKSVEVLEKLYA